MVASVLITPPATEPLTLAELKAHLHVDADSEDATITAYGKAARLYAEQYTNRAFITQTWQYQVDDLEHMIMLPKSPFISLTSFTYLDADGIEQTVDNTLYKIGNTSEQPTIYLKNGESYEAVLSEHHAVTITYVAGYGDGADVPDDIKQAILLLTAHFYEVREPVSFANNMYEMPFSVKALLDMNRIFV